VFLCKADVANRYQFATFGEFVGDHGKARQRPRFANVDLQLELWRQKPICGSRQNLSQKSIPPELLESFLKVPDLAGWHLSGRSTQCTDPSESETGVYQNGYSPSNT
jgi:hypothetical protein